jgi:hypothetical protein
MPQRYKKWQKRQWVNETKSMGNDNKKIKIFFKKSCFFIKNIVHLQNKLKLYK